MNGGEGDGEGDGDIDGESGEDTEYIWCESDWVCAKMGEGFRSVVSFRGNSKCCGVVRTVWSDLSRSWYPDLYPSMSRAISRENLVQY